MTNFFDQLIYFFAMPQGNLIYSLVLGVLVFGAFQSSLYATGHQVSPMGKRMQKALLYLLLAQMVLFTMSWFAWIGIIDEHALIPPLDRMIALFSLVIIVWLWVFPGQERIADGLTIALEVLILLAGIYSIFWLLGQEVDNSFNTSVIGAYGYYLGVVLLVVGFSLLVWKRPFGWEFGIVMLGILIAGYAGQYLFRQPAGDYPWLVRIGEVAAFTILLALPRRLVPSRGAVELVKGGERATSSPRVDAQVLKPLLDLINEKVPQQYYQKLTQWVAHMTDAEVCLLMIPPKNGDQLIILAGYTSQNGQYLDGFTVDAHRMPTVLDAIRKGTSVQIDGSAPDTEPRALISELGFVNSTNLLLIPFKPSDSIPAMGLVLLSNPSFPIWEAEDGSRLTETIKVLNSYLPQFTDRNKSGALQEDLKRYQQAYIQLKSQYEVLSSQAKNAAFKTDNTAALLESQKSLQELVKYLDERNHELENLVSKSRPSIDEVDQLRQELRTALEELARIPTALSKSDQKMLGLQLSAMKQLDEMGQSELVTSIAQEFRQPLSSIIGYTDLLLAESVGILGATQRKFLERVKASTERLGTMINDLVQMVASDGGNLNQTLVRVDLEAIIDDAIGEIIAQISEKNITMRVDLPEKLPAIKANKDALQQILANLLQNACLVTFPDGEIRLLARVEDKENEPNYLLISVTDQGGGIAKVNVARIFSRHYKDDNPSIPGIGDTGVGLSIVKSLVELQKGRIWVDTKEGSGSTFSCIIPLAEGQPAENDPGII